MTFRADMHTHSTCSDGTESPKELVKQAKELGLSGLAITDHDSCEAYAIAKEDADKEGILLLSGAEFSACHKGTNVHILGYAFPPDNEEVHGYCRKHAQHRRERITRMIQNLKRIGLEIEEEEVYSMNLSAVGKEMRSIGRPHIANVLIAKGYAKNVQECFNKYLGDGKPGYVDGVKPSALEIIELIHRAKGYAVLAHPHLIKRKKVVRDILEMPLDGIEGYYARFPRDQEKRWVEMGKEKGLIVTGGSDFHGSIKPHIPLGSSWVDEETFHFFYDHFCEVS